MKIVSFSHIGIVVKNLDEAGNYTQCPGIDENVRTGDARIL
jgi:hypothetical protein